jgi:hypothetical protein
VSDLDRWWEALRAASLVGTARREVPVPPAALAGAASAGAGREATLLELAAVGDAVRRAGAVVLPGPAPDPPAPEEERLAAPATAVQILGLLLTQLPVGAAARDRLVLHWLDTAAAADRVVPARLLPDLLELGAGRPAAVRGAVARAVGARGAWLAARNPAWHWLATSTEPVATSEDPRASIEEDWESRSAPARAAMVAALAVGLGPDDEAFLERCLDDRARAVREEARRLLDRLPGSARAGRMADRLRPLLNYAGGLRKRLDVRLPDDPDPAAVRDGLVDPGPTGSKRAFWRDAVTRGAPLTVWTDAVRGGPEAVVALVRGFDDSLLRALSDAAAGRGDVAWARALVAVRFDTRLAAVLPPDERDELLAARCRRESLGKCAAELARVPTPWGPRLSGAVLAAVGREQTAGHGMRVLRDTLPEALDPGSLPAVEKAMHAAGEDSTVRTILRDVLQYQSLHRSISEAFR